jgi:hypothetical protein
VNHELVFRAAMINDRNLADSECELILRDWKFDSSIGQVMKHDRRVITQELFALEECRRKMQPPFTNPNTDFGPSTQDVFL